VASLALAAEEALPSALQKDPAGWTDLLAGVGVGSELKGWTRGTIPPGKPLSARSQWSMDPGTGCLVCQGDGGHEWLRWDHEVADSIFHVEWRYTPVTSGKMNYNSGVYTRNSSDARVWHQAQIGGGSGGFLFGQSPAAVGAGTLKGFNLLKQMKGSRVKPAGEWNTLELRAEGKTISLWVNGAVTSEWHECQMPKGFVGLEAEGYRIEFRNVKLKTL
jgi:hypothetical protein